jgi:hypothetical protein
MTIEETRKSGIRTNVQHYRMTERGVFLQTSRKRDKKGIKFSATGGITVVTLSHEGETSTAISSCSVSDNFCYKTGTEIALSRALAALKSKKTN